MSCMVVEPKKVTFLHIAKTGGTSIRFYLTNNYKAYTTPEGALHITAKETKRYFGKDLGIKFCVTRNPYDRWASLFYHTSRNEKFPWYKDLANHNHREIRHHFFAFLTTALNTKFQNNLQWNIAKDCDYVLRFDQIEKDFSIIQDILGDTTPLLPKENTNPWVDDYSFLFKNKRIIQVINKVSNLEFEHLGYERINNSSI